MSGGLRTTPKRIPLSSAFALNTGGRSEVTTRIFSPGFSVKLGRLVGN